MVGSTIKSTKILKSTAVEPINKYYNSTCYRGACTTIIPSSTTIDVEQSKTTRRDIQ